jgi:hypothetical protein
VTILAALLSPILSSDLVTSIKDVAAGLGLIPSDWAPLDPEDAIIESSSQTFAMKWNTYATVAIQGGFLDTAAAIGSPTAPANGWIKLLASSVFNVTAQPATFAQGGWTGTNATGGNLGPYSPGQLKFYNLDAPSQTYSNTTTVTFLPGVPLTVTISADFVGSQANAAPSRIALLNTVLGLTGANALSIAGLDAETSPALANRCRLKYYGLSPNGASQAYQYVALTRSLNGGVAVNRVAVSPSSTNGSLIVALAGPSGPLSGGDVTTVQNAIYGVSPTPGGVVPDTVYASVITAAGHTINVTWVAYYHSTDNIVPATEMTNGNAALVADFQLRPIAGDAITPGNGRVFVDHIKEVLGAALPKAFDIQVSAPANDVAIAGFPAPEVPTLGTVPTNPAVAIQVVA